MRALPIILAHGICPFHRFLPFASSRDNAGDDRFHYFRKIRTTLIANGFTAFHVPVGWASSLAQRAWDLKKGIVQLTDHFRRWSAVHIIGHSMGGLDTRHMIWRYQIQDRVVSLTTIGTPHWGTAYADWRLARAGHLIDSAKCLGLDLTGFKELSREACRRRNADLCDFEKTNGVVYRTVAGAQPLARVFRPLRTAYRIIWDEEGENDGLVSVKSATWQERFLLEVIDADHLNQIGWWDGGEGRAGRQREAFEKSIRDVYLMIAGGLKDLE
jgi:triacylglycerol lipase